MTILASPFLSLVRLFLLVDLLCVCYLNSLEECVLCIEKSRPCLFPAQMRRNRTRGNGFLLPLKHSDIFLIKRKPYYRALLLKDHLFASITSSQRFLIKAFCYFCRVPRCSELKKKHYRTDLSFCVSMTASDT